MKNNAFDSINNAATNNNSNNGGIAMMNETINSMKDFADTVKATIEVSLGAGFEVEVREVLKNNDTHLTGITIRSVESNIAPTIYLEGFYGKYQGGKTIFSIAEEIIRIYDNHKVESAFDVTLVTDFHKAKDKICFRLVNADRNRELLEDAPHLIVCDDLAVIFYILVSNDGEEGTATITIRSSVSDPWGMTAEELFKIALDNTQRLFRGSVRSMASVMKDIFGDRLDEENAMEFFDMAVSSEDMAPLYVATNTARVNGAGVILYKGLLKEFAERTGSDFYILPSSVHETILVPVSEQMELDCLVSMVREVNATQVAPEEVLSDNVYIYHRDTDKICLA